MQEPGTVVVMLVVFFVVSFTQRETSLKGVEQLASATLGVMLPEQLNVQKVGFG